MDFSTYFINRVVDFLKCCVGDKEFLFRINPFPSLTLQSARNLKVPSPSKRSKAFLV